MSRKPSYDDLLSRNRELEAMLSASRVQSVDIIQKPTQEGEEHFRELVMNSPIGISIIQDEKIVYRNPEQQRIFGPLCAESTHMFEKIHPEDRGKFLDMYNQTLSGASSSIRINLKFIHLTYERDPEGTMRWLDCRSNLIEYQGRKAVLVNMIDITKEREMERLLNIQDRMASLGHVAAGIAHEIRNPLSGINIYVDTGLAIIEDAEESDDLREVFENIHFASAKIESVIKRVLDFSRPSEPKLIPLNINVPIRAALGLSTVMLRKNSIELREKLDENLPHCLADGLLIEQVTLNLITNAAEAMKNLRRGKKLDVRTSAAGEMVIVSIADSGPGIPPPVAQKIFDPFFTTKKNSTGIGLSLCQRIIQDHKGTLDVAPGKTGGAEFVFTIPVARL